MLGGGPILFRKGHATDYLVQSLLRIAFAIDGLLVHPSGPTLPDWISRVTSHNY
jgi:hypothetical protein